MRTLVELAKHIGVATVAEWVEDVETARILAEWGVTYFQGELYRHVTVETVSAETLKTSAA